uniref:Cadherin domain-containing protein n=1 Tax=Anopheles minimus TaxID=112268 RepID=A0A182VQ55_9DIPT
MRANETGTDIERFGGKNSIIPLHVSDRIELFSNLVLYFQSFLRQATDGLYTTLCNVNITIRDVNNHAPQFARENYLTSIEENFPIGTIVERLHAIDLDTGINAEIR